ncbi:MAG: hypothetical protein QOJ80_2461 [Mycobacterium sp.]|jgi:RNA polymerase sigma-70 factor (ECF subfamily)|nr:hypothetical protein [Mycobacterium sp.]
MAHLEEALELRPLLFSIAYRMLGSVADAEDIVQPRALEGLEPKLPAHEARVEN